MYRYKVGDKVKVISNYTNVLNNTAKSIYKIGQIVTIQRINTDGLSVSVIEHIQFLYLDEIEFYQHHISEYYEKCN